MPTDQSETTWDREIAALLQARTIAEAAQLAGVCERTMRNRLANAEFSARYRAERRRLVEEAIGRLQRLTGQAVDALSSLLRSRRPAVKLAAARTVLDHAHRGVELGDILERLEALEAAQPKPYRRLA